MQKEQQVGQTLRALELLIWEDRGLRALLERERLELEDVRATYVIAMTGPDAAIVEGVEGARTLRDVRAGRRMAPLRERLLHPSERGALLEFLKQHNGSDLPKALARLAVTAAVSAVLSFVAGLGDRHDENFMLTANGRLLHIDYGYALGHEPLDSMLIHYAVQGSRPATTLQYEELHEALGPDLLRRVFWPVARGAFLSIRRRAGLLAELVHTAIMREPRRDFRAGSVAVQRCWLTAQAFVSRNCVTSMSEACAEQFVHALLRHCARHERGAQLRDGLKGLFLRQRTHQVVANVYSRALATGRSASAAVGFAAGAAVEEAGQGLLRTTSEATAAAKGAAVGLFDNVRELVLETGGSMAITEGPGANVLAAGR